MYLLWKEEVLLQSPLLKPMIKVFGYPLIFCFMKKMPDSYCELCANPRKCRQIPVCLPGPQGQIPMNTNQDPNKS